MLTRPPTSSLIDVVTSINSGQTFLWENQDDSWYGVNGKTILKISARDERIEYSSYPERQSWERELFRLDDDIEDIHTTLSVDRMIAPLIKKYCGLRILRQDPEQCLFSFVCASNTNIPMIRRMLGNMSRKFGTKVVWDGHEFFTFPSASALNAASIEDLRSCGVGYRSRAIKSAAETIVERGLDLYELRKAKYSEAKERLLQVYGIGNKIADCIMLFSLDKLDAFPIDLWIARALSKNYPEVYGDRTAEKLTSQQYALISEKMRSHFGKYAGYAQQYLYYDMRHSIGRSW